MRNFIAIVTLTLFALPVTAATYKWVDEKGTVNFTEDYGKVPQKYRKKAKVVGEEDSAATEVKEEPKVGRKAGDAVETKTEAATDKQGKKKAVYGGKDEEAWRKDFGKARADLKAAEDQLVETRGRLNDTSGMSRNEYLSVHNTIKSLESRVLDLRKKLDSMNESATKAGVPAELLQ